MASRKAPSRRVAILQLGLGRVGRALLEMVLEHSMLLEQRSGVSLAHVGVADSCSSVWNKDGLSETQLVEMVARKAEGRPLVHSSADPGGLSGNLPARAGLGDFSKVVVVDATASNNTGPLLCRASEDGWGVVLANKLPLAGSLEQYSALAGDGASRLGYESTVGAGLPVISTLLGLLDSGDDVIGVDGCFSGTLGFVCYCLQEGMSFSQAVSKAFELGYTEPDPRQDLCGLDVARKALILARTMGKPLDLANVGLEGLYPESMDAVTVPEFMAGLDELDADYESRVAQASCEGKVLRYVAEVDADGCRVGLRPVDRNSLMGALKGPDNIVRFQTRRYGENPVTIAGPGAGPEVTAAGVLLDILRLAQAG